MKAADKISSWNRTRKWKRFCSLFDIDETLKILDIGFGENELSPADNFLEKHYPYPGKITALGISTPRQFRELYPAVKAVQYDGVNFPFADKSFDIGWSNAVLEHVGGRDAQVHFLKEIERTCKSFFVSTPNRYFPVEVHTKIPLLHYLPKKMFDRFLKLAGKNWAAGDYMRLCSERELKAMLKDAEIPSCRILKNRLLLIPLDFVIHHSF